jgi:glycosyltransferase domain-containing protein
MKQHVNQNILQNLTICIFTFERPASLLRVVEFYAEYNIQLIILDASSDSNQSKFPDKIRYFHVPGSTLQERLIKFSNLVTTRYLVLSPDDDFFAIKGLVESLIFLEKNQEFSSVQGLRIRFFDYPNFHWIPDYTKQMKLEFTGDDNAHRLVTMGKKMHYIYSVIRFESYVKIANCLVGTESQNRNSFMVGEVIFNLTLPVLGKHKIMPYLYSARMAHSYEGSDIQFAFWVNCERDITAINLRKNLTEFYMREIPCSESEAINLMQDMIAHFSKNKTTSTRTDKFDQVKKILRGFNFTPKLRSISLVLKPRYLHFYLILIANQTYMSFYSDLKTITNFLKRNQIK